MTALELFAAVNCPAYKIRFYPSWLGKFAACYSCCAGGCVHCLLFYSGLLLAGRHKMSTHSYMHIASCLVQERMLNKLI